MIRAIALLLLAALGCSTYAVGASLPTLFAALLGLSAEASITLGVALLAGLAAGIAMGRFERDVPNVPRPIGMRWRRYFFAALAVMIALQMLGHLTPGSDFFRIWRAGVFPHDSLATDLLLATALCLFIGGLLGLAFGVAMENLEASGGRIGRSPVLALPAGLAGAASSALALCFGSAALGTLPNGPVLASFSALFVFVGFLLLALLEWWKSRRSVDSDTVPTSGPGEPARRNEASRFAGLEAALAGFALAIVAMVLSRVATLSFGDADYTAPLLAAAILGSLAFGSLVSALVSRPSVAGVAVTAWLAVAFLLLLQLSLDDAPYAAHALRAIFRDQKQTFPLYLTTTFAALSVALVVPIGLVGALFPALARALGRSGAARRISAFAFLGAALGVALGGYVLLLFLDLDEVFRVASIAFAILAAVQSLRLRSSARAVAVGLFAAACLAAVLLPGWRPERLASGAFTLRMPSGASFKGASAFFDAWNDGRSIELYQDDPFASAAVVRFEAGNAKGVAASTNGRIAGHAPLDDPTTTLLAVLPALLAEKSERVLLIGFGAGTTLETTVARGGVQRVVVAERSAAGVQAARTIDAERGKSFEKPGVELIQRDPLRLVTQGDERFDAIVVAPASTWVRSDAILFSQQFYAAAKTKLAPGGVFAQGLRIYDADDATVARVLRTFSSVFPRSAVWYGLAQDLLLVGFADDAGTTDFARVEARLASPELQASLAQIGIAGAPALFAHELVPEGVLAAAGLDGELETIAAPRVAADSALAHFSGTEGRLPPTWSTAAARVGGERSLQRQLAKANGGHLSEEANASAITELCRYRAEECAVSLVAWQIRTPDSPALAAITHQLATDPARKGWVAPALQTSLQQLLGVRPLVGGISFESARSATEVFARHYSHAEPLSQATLLSIWQRCDDRGKGQCLEGLDRVRHDLAQDGMRAKGPAPAPGAGD